MRLTDPRDRITSSERMNQTTDRFARTSRDRRPIHDPDERTPRTPAHEIALYIVCAIAAIVLLCGCGGSEPDEDEIKTYPPVDCTTQRELCK